MTAALRSPRYRFFQTWVSGVLRMYYRSIESYGLEFVPSRGRTLFIANHQTGLIDGLLVLGTLQQPVRLVIKHTLWENPIIGFFASGLGMIPVYRKQDLKPEEQVGDAKARFAKTFGRVESTFTGNENVLIFPEGKSHDSPHLLKLRSGAARMLLQTEADHDFRLGIQWLPVSLDLEVKDRPGGRVVLHYHPPRGLKHLRELYLRDPDGAVEKLREEMESYLSEVTLNFSTWEDRAFLEHLIELWLAQSPNAALLDRHNLLLKWKRVLENTPIEESGDWKRLRRLVEDLTSTLALAGIRPSELFGRVFERPSGTAAKGGERRRLTLKFLPTLFFWAPAIFFGRLFWGLPTALIARIAQKGAGAFRDVVSTYHVVASLILYPAWTVLFFVLTSYAFGSGVAVALMILEIAAGLSIVTAARRLKLEFREIFNMYRYRSLQELMRHSEAEVLEIWAIAARLWNRALRRQILIEDPVEGEGGAA